MAKKLITSNGLTEEQINSANLLGIDLSNTQPKTQFDVLDSGSQFGEGFKGNSNYDTNLQYGDDQEDVRAKNQGFVDELANSLAQGTTTAVTSTVGGTVGLANGLLSMVADKDKSFFDNTTFDVMKSVDEWAQEQFPVYAQKANSTGNFSDILSSEKLLPGLMNGLGFVAGGMAAGMGNTALLKAIPKLVTLSKVGQTNKALEIVKSFGLGDEAANSLITKLKTSTEGLNNLAVASFGRIYESALEGNQVHDEALANGATPEEADYLRRSTFAAQMVLALPDAWQYGKLMSGLKGASKTVGEITQEGGEWVGKKLTGKAAALTNLGEVGKNMAVEAGEEMFQSITQKTSDILAKNGRDDNTGYMSSLLTEGLIEGMQDPETYQAGFLGAIIGGGMTGYTQLRESEASKQNKNTEYATELLNKYAPQQANIINEANAKLNEWGTIEKQKTALIAEIKNPLATQDKVEIAKNEYKQLDNLQLSNTVKAYTEAGKFDDYLNELELHAKTNNEELKSTYQVEDKIDDNGNTKTVQQTLNDKIQTAKKYRGIYEKVKEQYTNVPNEYHSKLYDLSTQYDFNTKKHRELSLKESKLQSELVNQNIANREVNPDFIEDPNNPISKQIAAITKAKNYYTIDNNRILNDINNIVDPQTRIATEEEVIKQTKEQEVKAQKEEVKKQAEDKITKAKEIIKSKEEPIYVKNYNNIKQELNSISEQILTLLKEKKGKRQNKKQEIDSKIKSLKEEASKYKSNLKDIEPLYNTYLKANEPTEQLPEINKEEKNIELEPQKSNEEFLDETYDSFINSLEGLSKSKLRYRLNKLKQQDNKLQREINSIKYEVKKDNSNIDLGEELDIVEQLKDLNDSKISYTEYLLKSSKSKEIITPEIPVDKPITTEVQDVSNKSSQVKPDNVTTEDKIIPNEELPNVDLNEDVKETSVEEKIIEDYNKSTEPNEPVEKVLSDKQLDKLENEIKNDVEEVNSTIEDKLKIVSGLTVANLSRGYTTIKGNKVNVNNKIFKGYNSNILKPNEFIDGEVTLKLVETPKYTYYDNVTGEAYEVDNNSTDPNKAIIEIYSNNQLIGFLHTPEYCLDNVADFDVDGIPNNIIQKDIVTDIRKKVLVEKQLTGTIINKGTGIIAIDSNQVYKPISERGFDERAIIGVAKEGKFYDGLDVSNIQPIGKVIEKEENQGLTFVVVPTSNGTYLPTYVKTPKLDDKSQESVFKAIESFLTKKEIKGLDLSSLENTKNYISQFVQVIPFDKHRDYTTNIFSIGEFPNGDRYFVANFEGVSKGTIYPFEGNEDKLKEHISKLYQSTSRLHLTNNTQVKFIEDNKAVLDKPYKDFLKDRLLTKVQPITIGDQLTYTVQPNIVFEITNSKPIESVQQTPVKKVKSITVKKPKDNDEVAYVATELKESYIPENTNTKKLKQVVDTISRDILDNMNEGKPFDRELTHSKELLQGLADYHLSGEAQNDGWSNEESLKIIDEINKITPQFKKYSEFALAKIKQLGYQESEYDELIGDEADREKTNFEDGAVFLQDPRNTISAHLKYLLSFIPTKNKNGEPIPNFIGTITYKDFDGIYQDLLTVLADTDFSYSNFKDILLTSNKNPYFKDVVALLQESDQSVQNEFTSGFAKIYAEFKITNIGTDEKETGNTTYNRVFSSNRNSLDKVILNQWEENKIFNPLYTKNEDEEIIVNESNLEQLNNLFDNAKANKDNLKNYLEFIGIKLSDRTINQITNNSTKDKLLNKSSYDNLFKNKGLFENINKHLNKKGLVVFDDSSFKTLAKLEARYSEQTHTNSHKNGEGKTIYSYVQPSFAKLVTNRVIRNIDYVQGLLNTSFASGSSWLKKMLNQQSNFYKNFQISFEDTLKIEDQDGVKNKNMSKREYEYSKIAKFINGLKQSTAGVYLSEFAHLTPSDKTTFNLYQAEKIIVDYDFTTNELIGKEKPTEIDKAYDELEQIVKAEYRRYYKSVNGEKQTDADKYNEGAKNFFLFTGLNTHLNGYIEQGITYETLPEEAKNKIKEVINTTINKMVKDQISEWKDLGIIKQDGTLSDLIDTRYKNWLKGKYGENIVKGFALDYTTNYFIANYNIAAIVTGDPAFFWKDNITKTYENYFKRIAKDIAPGIFVGNDEYAQVFAKDPGGDYAISKNISQYEKILGEKGAKPYREIELTDAQEYTTVNEHLYILHQIGKINTKTYNSLKESYKTGVFTEEELKVVLQPIKPVYVDNMLKNGVNRPVYIKSSSFPLVPQLTKGLPILEKIRINLEKASEKYDGKGRLAFKTAAKVGGANFVDLTKDDYIFTPTPLNREGFRIQQEIPYDETKDKILEGTQLRKLIFEGLRGKKYNEEVTFDELEKEFNRLHIELQDIGYNKLANDLQIDENGDFINLEAINKLLEEEASSRGFNINDLKFLKLTEDKKSFKIPLWANPQTGKYESLINSLINNRIFKQKLPGKSYILASEFGFDGLSEGIKYTSVYNAEKGLMPATETSSAQVFITPQLFREVNDLPKDFDVASLTKEQLRLVGYRIPTQGHNSMSAIEIAGFLPEELGDLVVAPKDFTKQMGSDFDIDKLYIHINPIKTDEVSTIQSKIFNIYFDVLSSKEVYPKMITPLDELNLPIAKKFIADNSKHEKNNFFSPLNQTNNFFDGIAGKVGTGRTSLLSTFNSAIQGKDIYLRDKFTSEELPLKFIVDGKQVSTSNLSTDKGLTGKSKASVIAAFQSASVDNIKSLILNTINYNEYTHNAMSTLALTIGDEEYIAYFLAQPIIKEYVKQYSVVDDSISDIKGKQAKKELALKNTYNVFGFSMEPFSGANFEFKPYSIENLKSILTISKDLDILEKNHEEQKYILSNFLLLTEIGEEISATQLATNIDTSGIGKNLFELTQKLETVDKLTEDSYLANRYKLVAKDTITGNAIRLANKFKTTLDHLFAYNSILASDVYKNISNIQGNLSADDKSNIFKFIRAYSFSNLKTLFDDRNITDYRKQLMFGDNTLAKRWYKFKNTNPDNYLAKRIQTSTDTYPNLIKYIASAEDRYDSINNTITLIEMLQSDNETTKQLAIDTVAYLYLNGGNQDAINFVKYLPAEYLSVNNFAGELINFNDTEHTNNIVKQYFQHNPYKIPVISEGLFQREGKGKSLKLYQKVNDEYIPMNKLGSLGFNEVQANTSKPKSLIKSNNTETEIEGTNSTPTEKANKVPNIPVSKDLDELGFVGEFDKNKIKEILNNVPKSNKLQTSVSNLLLQYVDKLPNLNLELSSNLEGDGAFDPKTNTLHLKSTLNKDRAIQVFQHELIHAITLGFVKKLKSGVELSKKELEIKNQLEGLFNKLEKEFTKKYGKEFTDYITKLRSKQIGQINKEYNSKFYGLVNEAEFLSELFTSKDFFNELNQLKFDGAKTMVKRFMEILKSIFEAVGININQGTYLEEGIRQALNIFESTNLEKSEETAFAATKSSIDKYITILQNRINRLNLAVKNSKDKVYKETVNKSIDKLKDQLDNLLVHKGVSTVINQGYEDLNYIQGVLAKSNINEHEINEIRKLTKSYSTILNELKFEQPETQIIYDELGNKKEVENELVTNLELLANKFDRYEKKIIDIEKRKVEGIYKQLFNSDLTFEQLIKEPGALSKMNLDASRQGNALLTTLSQLITNANIRAKEEEEELQNERLEQFDLLKNNLKFKEKGFNLFINEEGKLQSRFTGEYWKTKYNLINKAKKSREAKDWNNYYKWIKDNHLIIDIRKLKDGDFTDNYKKEIYDAVGEKYGRKLIKESIERYKNYVELEAQEFEEIDRLDLDDASKEIIKDRFKAENSPINYLEEVYDSKKTMIDGKYITNKGHYEYVVQRALKTKNNKPTKWYNPDFEIIESDPALNRFYDYFTKTIKKGLDVYPEDVIESLNIRGNFIPTVAKSTTEVYNDSGVGGLIKGIPSNVIDWVSETKLDNEKGIRYDEEGDPTLNVSLLHTPKKYNPTTNKYEEDLTNKSNDLNKILKEWISATTTYKHKSQSEDQVRLLTNYINDLFENPELVDNVSLVKVKELADYQTQFFYGRKTNQEFISDKKVYTPEETKQIEELNKARENLSNLGLSEQEITERATRIDVEIGKLGKNLSGSKSIRSILNYIQLKSQGWNFFSPATEMFYGVVSNTTHAAGGKDFNGKDLKRAYSIMMNPKFASKVDFLMNKFQVLGEINGLDVKTEKLAKGMKVFKPYELAKRQDYFTKGASFIAMMLHKQVDGKSLFDLYDEEGLKEGVDKTYESTENGSEFLKFKNYADQVIKGLHGNYNINTPNEGGRYILYQVATQFRRWMFESLAQRYETKHFDPILGRERKGRYLSYGTAFNQLGTSKFLKSILLGLVQNKNAFAELDEVDQENMRKNMVGMYWNISLMMLIALVRAAGDDDEERWVATNFFLNQGYRLQSDINFYHNPSEFESISKNFVPAFGITKDFKDLKKAFVKTMEGNSEIEQGIWKGYNRIGIETADIIPGPAGFKKLASSVKQDWGDKF